MATSNRSRCPACGKRGSVVKPITIESLVTESARARASGTDGFHFCAEPSCDVVYFHPESGATIARGEVRVRIGEKQSGPPHPVCYCFEHTVEEIEAEVETTGTSKIAEGIAEKCRQGLDRCEETNPRGSCCLGHVRRAVREAPARRGSTSNAAPRARVGRQMVASGFTGPGCVLQAPSRSRSASFWASGGAVVAALLSSACCWLPLLLITAGASGAALSAAFALYRPLFVTLTFGFLAAAFYLAYRRQKVASCDGTESSECSSRPGAAARKLNRVILWPVTAAALAFVFFPGYGGLLTSAAKSEAESLEGLASLTLSIEGMHCDGCVPTVREALKGVPGVVAVSVDYHSGRAVVRFDKVTPASETTLLRAVASLGYKAARMDEKESK